MTKPHGPVLAITDLSDEGAEALRQGLAMASAAGVPLVVGHVFPEAFRVRLLFPQASGVVASEHEELVAKATAAVRAQVAAIAGQTKTQIEVQIESGSAHGGVLTIAERIDAGLIAIGPGSAAIRVARGADRPVLVARTTVTGGPVIGATDFSDPALPAVHAAAHEATRRGAELLLVHCLEIGEATYLAYAAQPGMVAMSAFPVETVKALEANAESKLREAAAATGVPCATQVLHRSAPAGILEAAETASAPLIVVGTRGRTGLRRLALGSVAEDVASHAKCSVLVVPLRPSHN